MNHPSERGRRPDAELRSPGGTHSRSQTGAGARGSNRSNKATVPHSPARCRAFMGIGLNYPARSPEMLVEYTVALELLVGIIDRN